MIQTNEVLVWVLMTASGKSAIGETAQEARDKFENDGAPLNEEDGFRMYKVSLVVPIPELVQIAATVPADEAEATVRVE